jgi:hypothetical protein
MVVMHKQWIVALAIGASLGLGPIAQALPGQGSDEVLMWMKSNPGIRPNPGEKLTIRRNNGPSQRMSFEASLLAPGRITPLASGGRIRSETLTLFDMLYGVSEARLEESIRSVYGLAVHRDFQKAQVVYSYPTPIAENQAVRANQPIAAALKGELRKGDRYAYWTEILRNREGLNYGGKVVVFLAEDLPKVESELKGR